MNLDMVIVGIETKRDPGWHVLQLSDKADGVVLFEQSLRPWQCDGLKIGDVLPVAITISYG